MLQSVSCTHSNTTTTSSFDGQLHSVNSGRAHQETIGASLQTRKILLLQMIKDIQNEAKYLKGFKLLVSFEDHRKEGIILSISDLNSMFISQPLERNYLQNTKQKEKEYQSPRRGHYNLFWNTKKHKRSFDKSNHNNEKLRLRGKSKERRKMRKALLGRYDVSNYDDQSIEYLIQNLIKLEKSLIVE